MLATTVQLTSTQHEQIAVGTQVRVVDPATSAQYVIIPLRDYNAILQDHVEQKLIRTDSVHQLAKRLAAGA